MDIITAEQRSRNMAAIRSGNTRPELYMRKLLFSKGYRYSINSKKVPGRPDIYLRKYNTAIFVHGCFWHRHDGCKYSYTPKSRVEFWQKKFEMNIRRDRVVKSELKDANVKCLVIWECSIKKMRKNPEFCTEILNIITDFFNSQNLYKAI
ncbi:very short patch repair endonuclease [uncultured Phascolarctobacterium sp.]|uniref:very short patch repair endonuclease n=1 Tax=Phascolarctobacterium sp. TaxID=2049039 RepID=UPI0025DD3083|nr:very short patch repair endonuclease [uncultured Phascolarctobacterium sp.]